MEKRTLWKINDCQKLLEKRVSEQFVNDAVEGLGSKIEKDMKFREEREIERLFKSFKELEKRIESSNDFVNDSFNQFRN